MIGYAKFDAEKFVEWNKSYKEENGRSWYSAMWTDYFYDKQHIFKGAEKPEDDDRTLDKFLMLLAHLKEIDEKLQLFYYDETASIVGYEDKRYVVNSDFIEKKDLKDYSKLLPLEMNRLSVSSDDNTSIIPMPEEENSLSSLEQMKADAEAELKSLQDQMDAERRRIEKEMEMKIQIMKENMELKMNEMNVKLDALKKDIFILEAQIFSIRFYTGEVIKFHKIRTGKPCDPSTPLVLYQKIRYMDEEMGKHMGVFNVQAEDPRIITMLRNQDSVADLLAPGPRSLTLIQPSRRGKYVAASAFVTNALQEYDLYHGKQIALLLRDGENLYIAWCDADKVKINEENAFYSTSTREESTALGAESSVIESTSSVDDMLSRYYLLSILQGMIDIGKVIKFDKAVRVLETPNDRLTYSLADGWISSNKYGTFAEMQDRSKDIELKIGDEIVTVLSARSAASWNPYESTNDRGVGGNIRTRGLGVRSNECYPINAVYEDVKIEVEYEELELNLSHIDGEKDYFGDVVVSISQRYTDKCIGTQKDSVQISFDDYKDWKKSELVDNVSRLGRYRNWRTDDILFYRDEEGKEHEFTDRRELAKEDVDMDAIPGKLYIKHIISAKVVESTPHVFVSLEQDSYSSYNTYNVNFEVYPDEFINAQWLCSSWIKEVIATGKPGTFRRCGATFGYADLLPYLYTLLETCKEREGQEIQMLLRGGGEQWVENNPDWDAQVLEWRIEHRYHALTDARAKKFIKEMTTTC